jgi:hypothetical protein
MLSQDPPSELPALRAAIEAFIEEGRHWAPERRALARRQIGEVQGLLHHAATMLGEHDADVHKTNTAPTS